MRLKSLLPCLLMRRTSCSSNSWERSSTFLKSKLFKIPSLLTLISAKLSESFRKMIEEDKVVKESVSSSSSSKQRSSKLRSSGSLERENSLKKLRITKKTMPQS